MKFIIFFFVFTTVFYGQTLDSKKDLEAQIIERELKKCLEEGEVTTTASMVQCVNQYYKRWDGLLNKYYKLLMSELSREGREKLRASQRKWLEFKGLEEKFIEEYYYQSGRTGTMWIAPMIEEKAEITAKRALELKYYWKGLKGIDR